MKKLEYKYPDGELVCADVTASLREQALCLICSGEEYNDCLFIRRAHRLYHMAASIEAQMYGMDDLHHHANLDNREYDCRSCDEWARDAETYLQAKVEGDTETMARLAEKCGQDDFDLYEE